MSLDKNGIFGVETYEKYLEMHQLSEKKMENLVKSLFLYDIFLFMIINSQNWSMPFLDIQVSSVPAIREVFLFISSVTFFFLCLSFVTKQCYVSIINQFANVVAGRNNIDPDFFSASRIYSELCVKIFSAKLNNVDVDFYEHGRDFAIFTWIMNKVIISVILTLPCTHFLLVIIASSHVIDGSESSIVTTFLICVVILINLGGLAAVIGMSKDFNFKLLSPGSDADSTKKLVGDLAE